MTAKTIFPQEDRVVFARVEVKKEKKIDDSNETHERV